MSEPAADEWLAKNRFSIGQTFGSRRPQSAALRDVVRVHSLTARNGLLDEPENHLLTRQATRHTFGTRRFLVWWQRFFSRPLRGAAILGCTPIDINQPHRKDYGTVSSSLNLEPFSQRPAPTRAVECVRPCENMLADDGPLVNEGPVQMMASRPPLITAFRDAFEKRCSCCHASC